MDGLELHRPLRRRALDEPAQAGRQVVALSGTDEVVAVGADDLLGLVPENLFHRRCDVQDRARRVAHGDDVVAALHQRTEASLRDTHGDLGLVAIRDVARRDDHAVHHRVVQQVVTDGLHVPPRAIGVAHAKLHGVGQARRRQRPGEHLDDAWRVVRMDELEDVVAHPETGCVTQHALARWARIHDAALGVEHGDDVRRVLEEGEESLLGEPQARIGVAGQPLALLRRARFDLDGASVRRVSPSQRLREPLRPIPGRGHRPRAVRGRSSAGPRRGTRGRRSRRSRAAPIGRR